VNSTAVRRALESDIPVIQRLETEAFEFTWDEKTFLRELGRDNGVTVVTESDGEVMGAALLVWAETEVQLNSLVISSEYRGRGIARTLLGQMMAWCRSAGLEWFTLEVKWDNLPALRLYRHFGFVTTARRKGYYRDGRDARIMWAGHLRSPFYSERLRPFQRPCLDVRNRT
jgi:ribosomal-protein-alanine N-acetyltransferase